MLTVIRIETTKKKLLLRSAPLRDLGTPLVNSNVYHMQLLFLFLIHNYRNKTLIT